MRSTRRRDTWDDDPRAEPEASPLIDASKDEKIEALQEQVQRMHKSLAEVVNRFKDAEERGRKATRAHGAEIGKLEDVDVRVMDEHADRAGNAGGRHRGVASHAAERAGGQVVVRGETREGKDRRGFPRRNRADGARRNRADEDGGERSAANVAVVGSNRVKIVHRVDDVRGETTDAAMLERNA